MTDSHTMNPLRRRPMPGMSTPAALNMPTGETAPMPDRSSPSSGPDQRDPEEIRRRSKDYSATRLVNFRLPVDLHDRYRDLVQETERRHPRIRRPSLTEVVIGLLEEGPGSVDEIAELIRRKRASEYTEKPLR